MGWVALLLLLHEKGGVWSVLGRSVSDVWAVGDDGTILHYRP